MKILRENFIGLHFKPKASQVDIFLRYLFAHYYQQSQKLFWRNVFRTLKSIGDQFGCRNKHSKVEQVHKLAATIGNKEYLDVSQAFDKVWHKGLACKMSKHLAGNYCQLLDCGQKVQEKTVKEPTQTTIQL